MNIAILGTRGVPPRYGGFETFAAELGTRLVARGHTVTVYCRERGRQAPPPVQWNGIRRIVLPAIPHKYFETVSHTFFSAIDALWRDFDVVLLCNAANAFVLPLLRAARMPVAINVDGIERRRRKWNFVGRAVYLVGETFSSLFANRVVADADVIAAYYRLRFGMEPLTIRYGADFPPEEDSDVLQRLGLQPRRYVLYASRFEPENNPLEVVLAYEKITASPHPNPLPASGEREHGAREPSPREAGRGWREAPGEGRNHVPLVMLGEGLYAKNLVRELRRHASDRILFPGALYGPDYRTLQRNALLYIQATEVGGTHPAMIEAMGSGGCVVAHDTPENREVGGEAVRYFQLRPTETLSGAIRECLDDTRLQETMRIAARKRVGERYRWDQVTAAYEALFSELMR